MIVNILFCTLPICVGVYLSALSGRLLFLRSSGHSKMFTGLDWLMATSPWISVLVLLSVGIFSASGWFDGKTRSYLIKIPLLVLTSVTPLAVHLLIVKVTYAVDAPPPKLFGLLSFLEWVVLFSGAVLIGIGVFLLVRYRLGSKNESAVRRNLFPLN